MCKSERYYKMLRKIKKCYPVGKFPYTFTEFIYWCTFVQKVNCPRDPGAYCPTAATMGTTRTKSVIVTVFPTAVNFLPHFFFLALRFVKSKRLRRTSVCSDSSLNQYYHGQLT